MNILSGTSALIPLPEFSLSSGRHDAVRNAGLRRFGISEADLSADFSSADRAALATYLLESCIVDPAGVLPAGFFRELSIGKRIECLLVLAAGGPETSLGFPFKCAGCNEEIELELTLQEISMLQSEADQVEVVGLDIRGRRLEFRKPTGRDQELWAGLVVRNERSLAAELTETLAVSQEVIENIEPEDLSAIEAAMLEADPLVDFTCSVNCGECGEDNKYAIDLMETALGMLNRAQSQLVIMIHRLASHYHWNEKEIFSVPHWRRKQYLELIGAVRK
ncbi:MAG TPA: hypothetical protein VGO50_02900 [Pyrinomonadaceae bacterium]|jgi:hypothetical protein|nr:hypothetical protein [Pyrinomonadaceae bacterium]